MSNKPVAGVYLIFEEGRDLISPETVELLVDTFDKTYLQICDFFDHYAEEIRPVRYMVENRGEGVAYTTGIPAGVKVGLESKWINDHPWDIDCMTHELIHVAQSYHGWRVPFWIVEGLADYGRDRFGIYNRESGWSLPAWSENQKFDQGYRVSAAFIKWIEQTRVSNFAWELNKVAKDRKYTDEWFKEKTGKLPAELWLDYAEESKAKAAQK